MNLIIDGYREIENCLREYKSEKMEYEEAKRIIMEHIDTIDSSEINFKDSKKDFVEDMKFILKDETSIEQALERVKKRIDGMNKEYLLEQESGEEEQERVTHVYVKCSGKYFCIPIEYYENLDKQTKESVDVIRLITNKKRMYGINCAEIYVKGEKVRFTFEKNNVNFSFLKPSNNDCIIEGKYDTNQKRIWKLLEEDTYDRGYWFKSEKQEFIERYLNVNKSLFKDITKHLEELGETHTYNGEIKTLRQLRSLIETGKSYPNEEARRQAEEVYLKQQQEKVTIQRTLDRATDAVTVIEGRMAEIEEQLAEKQKEKERIELEKKKAEERRKHGDYYSL